MTDRGIKLFSIANIYLLLWCLYYLQGVLYSEGGVVSRSILVLYLGMSVLLFFVTNTKYRRPLYLKVLNILVAVFAIYGLLRIIQGSDVTWKWASSSSDYLKNSLLSTLPVYSFYYFTKKGLVDEKWFRVTTVIFLIMAVIMYFHFRHEALLTMNAEEITNNMGYLWVSMFPILFFFNRRRLIQYALLLVILYFVFMGFKRGAILVSIVATLFFFLCVLRSVSPRKRLFILLLSLITIAIGFYFVSQLSSSNDYFNARLGQTLEGNASNREWMYPMYLDLFLNQGNPFSFLFGNGADGTLRLTGGYAHQDWLEIAINQGVIGIALYLIYWVVFFSTYFSSRKMNKTEVSDSLGIIAINYFLISLFSMSINGMYLFSTSVLGYCLAKYDDFTRIEVQTIL